MGFEALQKQNRTDRILILVALAMFIVASGLFYFDNWMWGGRFERGESIGNISDRSGDVRVKFEGDLKWQKAGPGQSLVYNDSIYAGADSQAQLQLGASDMTVSENTLVVLRREQKVNFMNLAYGSLFGNIAKNEKVVIDTGEGKPIELSSRQKTSIVVKKTKKGHTELVVKSGEVDLMVAGKKQRVGKNTRITVEEKAPAPKIEHVDLEIVKPLSSQVIHSADPVQINFVWRWSNNRNPAANDKYTIEFSTSPSFETLVTKRQVTGSLTMNLTARESLSMHYRVRGPNGELSTPEKVTFVRMHKPLIVKPVANSIFKTPSQQKARVGIEFDRPARAQSIWYQVANDPKFENVLSVENTLELRQFRDFAPGMYYLRAKADFGDNRESGWTEGVPFKVDKLMEGLSLSQRDPPAKILVPNVDYPQRLYFSEPWRVRDYLAKRGFLRKFFPYETENFDQIHVKFADEIDVTVLQSTAWPVDKMKPAVYSYRYQIAKKDFDPSPWSDSRRLEIAMEPPRNRGEPQYGTVNAAGEVDVSWKFTPLLFARSYDVQLAKNPQMINAKEWQTDGPQARARISQESYWRVRARDNQGRVISDYSQVYRLLPPPTPILAKREEPKREPAATEKVTQRVERVREEVFEKSGLWTWVGMGQNFVDYSQSNSSRGTTLNDQHVRGPSTYLEVGYVGKSGNGGVLSFTQTPGTIDPRLPDGVTIDTKTYTWTTVAAEGMMRKTSPFSLFGTPIVYGLRLGLQQHRLPYVHIDALANLYVKRNISNNVSAGVLAEWSRRRWTYYWLMRYQYPLSTSADGSSEFSMKPVVTFDGSVGTSYNFTRRLKAGVFWNGQWHQFNFVYSDPEIRNSGFQSLFYSNLDFRLGWDF